MTKKIITTFLVFVFLLTLQPSSIDAAQTPITIYFSDVGNSISSNSLPTAFNQTSISGYDINNIPLINIYDMVTMLGCSITRLNTTTWTIKRNGQTITISSNSLNYSSSPYTIKNPSNSITTNYNFNTIGSLPMLPQTINNALYIPLEVICLQSGALLVEKNSNLDNKWCIFDYRVNKTTPINIWLEVFGIVIG